MYDSGNRHDGHCLFSSYMRTKDGFSNDVLIYARSENIVTAHQTVAYCLRSMETNISPTDFDIEIPNDQNFTFMELKHRKITSEMLLEWSASIDLAEEYQSYLNNNTNGSLENEILFYNCTPPWFGSLCQFTFDYYIDKSFDHIVGTVFDEKTRVNGDVQSTCYEHLYCATSFSCLDWHEICDGKNDCLDGSDENNCWQLEVNRCTDKEFRCHDGQCIPMEFYQDVSYQADCLDRTDETIDFDNFDNCLKDPSFRCEEHTCSPGNEDIACGDGQCTNGIYKCLNGRNRFISIDFCSNATACSIQANGLIDIRWCKKFCPDGNCLKKNCSTIFEFRYIPMVFGHVRFFLSGKDFKPNIFPLPDYVCYDEKLCADIFPVTVRFNNLTCRLFADLGLKDFDSYHNIEKIIINVKNRFRGCSIRTNKTHCSDHTTMYQCEKSLKCISKQRLLDGISDCPLNDDERYNQSCSLSDSRHRFQCLDHGKKKCFSILIIGDGKLDCVNGEDEVSKVVQWLTNHISFQTICDGKRELSPVLIDGRNETDETECDHWPCNNIYTRCDRFWLCKDGADETNCPSSTCPEDHHACVLLNDTSQVSCLSTSRVEDGNIDCLGSIDEGRKFSKTFNSDDGVYEFQCLNSSLSISIKKLCDREADCQYNDDEIFCSTFTSIDRQLCDFSSSSLRAVDRFFCSFHLSISRPNIIFFNSSNIPTYASLLTNGNHSITKSTSLKRRAIVENQMTYITPAYAWQCNRGVPIRIRININRTELYCLCPPSYFGDQCQYQNQRVSLTIQIRVTSNWRRVFIFVIILIDNERNIQSHDHIEYLPIRDCRNKFNVYLLYSTRPKNSSKTYSIQVDLYDQLTLKYQHSWIFPLQFEFLPVHRLPIYLKIPFFNINSAESRCWPSCIHGQCLSYLNDRKSTFCRCESGWFGIQCNIKYTCQCASDSRCLSNSICVCPRNRFGPRCFLSHQSCHTESCLNGGQCVPTDTRYSYTYDHTSICICQPGYQGRHCEHRQIQTRIDVSFHRQVTIPTSLLIHLVRIRKDVKHNTTSIMKKVLFDQTVLTIYTSSAFNFAFAQSVNSYYLIILQQQEIILANITTELIPSHRCQSLDELFNQTFAKQHLLKRIKYYHIPCKKQPQLVCFHDDVHFCLCTKDRQSNCFEFDHNMTHDCRGDNICENEGHCLVDNPRCPTSSLCACQQCYFGSVCQFSTKGSSLSLDIILTYHIFPNLPIVQQPTIIKVSIFLTMIMFIFGTMNSFFSFQTFRRKETRNVGCGFYLFTSSIISMLIMTIFLLKFWFLLLTQMGLIINHSFSYVQCVFIDYFLRLLLNTDNWLSACIAIERAMSILQGIKFNKRKSTMVAKWIICILIIFISCTFIYDPISRLLVRDEEEQRIWCVTKYSASVQLFDRFLTIVHFSVPFSINCISGLIIIVVATRTRSKSQSIRSFGKHLQEQIHRHKHLLISSLILVLLAIPRLVISYLSGCMESARSSWFYLTGYFISFIPSMMTLIVFILPSDMYKKEFIKSIKGT